MLSTFLVYKTKLFPRLKSLLTAFISYFKRMNWNIFLMLNTYKPINITSWDSFQIPKIMLFILRIEKSVLHSVGKSLL